MTAQELRARIGENAMEWRETADKKKRQALHEENVALYKELDGLTGTTSVFDPETGRWSSSEPGAGNYVGTRLPEARDLSEEVKRLRRAADRKAELGLAQAKKEAERALDAQEDALGESWQAARNQAAAQGDIQRKDLGEWAARSGLNTGTAGQIALGQSMAVQGELGKLDREEAQARDALAQARRELEEDHAYALAQAKAEGEAALADALYKEAARYDGELGERAYRQEGMDREVYDSARDNRRWEATQQLQADKLRYEQEKDDRDREQKAEELDYRKEKDALERADKAQLAEHESDVKLAQSRAAYGDFWGYARLGYSREEIERMTGLWRYYQFIR